MHSPGTQIIQDVDEQALATILYQSHAQVVLHYLLRRVSVREDAEDLLLEVFLSAVEKKTPLHLPDKQQLAWLLHVARHKTIDHYRHNTRHPSIDLSDQISETLFVDDDFLPEKTAERSEDHQLLREHFATLPEQYQKVLWLRFAYDLRVKGISQHLHKSEGAVRTLLSRALNSLRHIYTHQQGESYHEAE